MNKFISLTGALILFSSQLSMAAPPSITAGNDDLQNVIAASGNLRAIYNEALQINATPPSSFEELGYQEFQLKTD